MELIVANLSKSIRRERLEGHDYLVAPVTLIVPGVLDGSQGSQYYPLDEIRATFNAWNHMPLLLSHPKGESGRSPQVIEKTGIGTLYNVEVNGKLTGEAWFNIEKTNKLDSRIIPSVMSGQKLEISTGLRIDVDTTPGVFNGVDYVGIARHYRPDHLVILPDSIGACSIGDGCGVNNKKETIMSLTEEQRTEKVDALIANCECWKEDDRDLLMKSEERSLEVFENAFNTSKKLKGLETENKKKQEKVAQTEKLLEVAKKGFDSGNDHWSLNEDGTFEKKKKTMENKKEGKDPEPMKLEDLPEEVQNKLARFDKREAKDKEELIVKMVNHLAKNERQAAGEKWNEYDLETLQGMAPAVIRDPLMAKSSTDAKPDYTGQAVAHNTGGKEKFTPEPLGIPVMNFEPTKS